MTATEMTARPVREHLPALARGPVLVAAAAVALALTISSNAYGYHRDELYFRMLPLRWGYVDQPPLTPLIARMSTAMVGDTVAGIHVPATLLTALSVIVVTLITRELGGGRAAQTLCAWAYGFSLLTLNFGHVLLTATVDMVVWPAVVVCCIRAVLRDRPRWWLLAGLITGLSMYNKLLIAALLISLAGGIALAGPRSLLRSRWVWTGVAIALVVGAPNLVYQATHDWPQVTMGRALAHSNAAQVRLLMWPYLLVMFGPPLVPIWSAGALELLHDPRWRPVRFLAAAVPVMLAIVWFGGSQFYYPFGLMTALLAAGCVVVARWADGHPVPRWPWVVGGVAVNAIISVVIALPVLPVTRVGSTLVPTFNQIAQDQIGWPTYVGQVAAVRATLSPQESAHSAVVTANYGEAGAVARYGPALGIDRVYSAQNELYFVARPPGSATTAIFVGVAAQRLSGLFEGCQVAGTLDNGVGVDNEEQGRKIIVCRGPRGGWERVWPQLQHYD